jgi:hypothetical protein
LQANTTAALDSSTSKTPPQKNSPCSRDFHRGTPGAYEKLAAFANKIIPASGGRAALALGYDDF